MDDTAEPSYVVVWSGRDPLLPAEGRQERWDDRYAQMPTFDIDDGEVAEKPISRKYTRTGKHVGKFSRTNPAALQYIPTKRGN